MAVALRSQAVASGSTAATLTLSTPVGVQDGDYLIAFIHSQASGSSSDISLSGWTRINAAFIPSDNGSRVTGIFAKIATSSEPANFVFTVPGTGTRSVGFIAAYSGVDTTSPVAYSSAYTKNSSSGSSLNISSDSGSANYFTIELWAANYASPNSYALGSYTGGLSLLGEAYNPAGAENTGVSRSALRVWQGNVDVTGMPSHVITTGTAAQMSVSTVSLNASSSVGGVLVTPTIIGHTTASNSGSGATITLNPETNRVGVSLAISDWVIAVFTSASTLENTKQPIPPAGWTNIVPFGTVGTGTVALGVWAHKKMAGESTYTWSQSSPEVGNTSHRMIFVRHADDIDHWVMGPFQNRATSSTTTTNVAPSITAASYSLGLLLSIERTVATETDGQVTCDNFTKDWFDNSNDQSLFVAHKNIPSAGVTGTVTITYPNSHVHNGIAGILGIPGTLAGATGLPLKVSNGAGLVDARFKLADGIGGVVTPGGYRVVRPGYSSVTNMLSQAMFYCAHRGGSRDFPEMSLYAYGQSALLGYGAVELSLARSSDGVWFGLHDASLDRTSLGTNGSTLIPSAMTWAQIQSYSILGSVVANNPSQASRPYMRWEELMSLYYGTHVIFVDPKVAISYRGELLNMMDVLPGTPTNHFVAKYYGVAGGVGNTSGWAYDAANRGYKSWGYFYQADVPSLATYQGRWDILGMDYGADQSSWIAVLSYGKPVMAHILPSTAAFTTAVNYGAHGVMVSGVKSIITP